MKILQYFAEEDEIVKWEEYIGDKYNYFVDLIISADANIIETDIDEITEKTNLSGFVYNIAFWQLERLIEADVLMPVNDFIFDIPEYAGINSMIIAGYADRKNNIWALPFGELNDFLPNSTRFYNKKWLEKAGVEIPKTLDEFYSYAKYVAENDPDANGINDTYIDIIDMNNITEITRSLSDIWTAFGCYFDMGPISYNPETGIIEDFILNESFISAVAYIKNLVDEGFIFLDYSSNSDETLSYNLASSGISQIDKTLGVDGFSIGHYLSGVNDSFLIKVNSPGTSLAVLKNTENPKKQVEALLEILKNGTDSYMDFFAGIEGIQYKKDGENYEILFPENETIPKIIFMDLTLEGFESENIMAAFESNEEEILYQQLHKQAKREANEKLPSDLAYTIPFDSYSSSLIYLNSDAFGAMEKLLIAIFIENKDIQDAVDEYRKDVESEGIPGKIDFLNTH